MFRTPPTHAMSRAFTWLRPLLLVLVLGLLTACGGDAPADDAADAGADDAEEATLRFAWWGSDVRHQMTQEVIDLYEEQNPHVTIDGEFLGFDDHWDNLATQAAGGNTPDIIQHEERYLREYAARGQLLNLDDHVEEIDTGEVDEGLLSTGQLAGGWYGVPFGLNVYALVADPEGFWDAGVDMPDGTGWTWDEYADVAAEITDGTDDGYYGGDEFGSIDAQLQIFVRQHGHVGLYDVENDDLAFEPELLEEFWERRLDLIDRGALPSADRLAEISDIDDSLLGTNQGATAFRWSNQLVALSELSGRELELIGYPGETEFEQPGTWFKSSQFLTASADTEHPDEAVRFIDFLTNDEEAARILLGERGIPVNVGLRDEIVDDLTPADQKVVEYLDELEGQVSEPPPPPPAGAGEAQQTLMRLDDQVMFGQLTPSEATEQFFSEAPNILGL